MGISQGFRTWCITAIITAAAIAAAAIAAAAIAAVTIAAATTAIAGAATAATDAGTRHARASFHAWLRRA